MLYLPKVVLSPVRWSLGPDSQSIFVEELSTLISSLLSTRETLPPGNLQVRLANGWVFGGEGGGMCRISVTLNCQIDPVSAVKAAVVRRIL